MNSSGFDRVRTAGATAMGFAGLAAIAVAQMIRDAALGKVATRQDRGGEGTRPHDTRPAY